MASKVTFTFLDGPLKGGRFGADERTVCILGRADDCNIRIEDGVDYGVSKYHCILDINPPAVSIKDLNSTNGTFVNGSKLKTHTPDSDGKTEKLPDVNILNHGAKIKIGIITIQVCISTPAICRYCSKPISPEDLSANHRKDGTFVCEECYRKSFLLPVLNIPYAKQDVTDNSEELLFPEKNGGKPPSGKKLEMKSYFNIYGFKIIRKLGEGGMASVYLAEDEKHGGKVALKILVPKVEVEQQASEEFLREIDNTTALDHPNIVKIFDSGYSNGAFYYSMGHMEYGDLHSYVVRCGGKLGQNEALQIVFQILDALEYAHNAKIPYVKLKDGSSTSGRGLIHRDLKPENIYISELSPTVIKIADFGLAKAFDLSGQSGCTATGTFGGTPAFMCRQQLINFKYSRPDIDVWSAAAILYYLLTGAYPRDFSESDDIYKKILESAPVPIRQRCPGLTVSLAQLIDAALDDKDNLKFPKASELKKAIIGAV